MYCTYDDLLIEIPEKDILTLIDDTGNEASMTPVLQTKVEAIIQKADNEINSYCMERYTVPLDPIPGIIKDLSVDLSIYKLHNRRGKRASRWDDQYKRAIEILEKISEGKMSLGTDNVKPRGVSFTDKAEDTRIFKDPMGY